MKLKIIKILKIIAIYMFFIGITKVFAVDNYTCNLSITENKTIIKQGETITYEIKATNINAGDGITKLEMYIDYDSNVFDCKVEADDDGKWSKTGLLEGYLTMDKSNLEPSSEDQVIAKVAFTAKTGVSNNTYQVKFTNISFTTGDNSNFTVSDKNVQIQVESLKSEDDNSGENTSSGSTSGENTSNGSTTSGSTLGENTSNGSTTSGSTLGESTSSGSAPSGSTLGENTSSGSAPSGSTSGESTSSGSTSDEKSSTVSNKGENDKNTNSSAKKNTKDNNIKIPYTGKTGTIEKILILGFLILLSAWFYIKEKRINI